MPKAKRVSGSGKARSKSSLRTKFKLGNRKVSRGAHQVSMKELEEYVASSAPRPRDKAKARAVLARRPKPVVVPSEQAAEVTAEAAA